MLVAVAVPAPSQPNPKILLLLYLLVVLESEAFRPSPLVSWIRRGRSIPSLKRVRTPSIVCRRELLLCVVIRILCFDSFDLLKHPYFESLVLLLGLHFELPRHLHLFAVMRCVNQLRRVIWSEF